MKKSLSVFLSAALLLALTACSGGRGHAPFDPASDAETLLTAPGVFTETLVEIDPDIACARYGVDAATVTAAAVYGSTGATAEELAVFVFDSNSHAADATTAMSLWLTDRSEELEDYLPREVDKLTGAILEARGSSVLLIIAANYGPVETFLGN